MSAQNFRIGLVTACLVTLLHLPAGALTFGVLPSVAPNHTEGSPSASQVALTSTDNMTLWFRTDFVLLPSGAAGPVEPTAQLAPPAVQPPATVENLRRSNQR